MRGRVAKKILKRGWRMWHGQLIAGYTNGQYDRAFRRLRHLLDIPGGAW